MLLLDSEEVFALPKHSGGRTGVHIYSTGKSAALGGRERFLRAHFSVKCFVMFIEVLVSIPRSLFLCEYRAEMAVLYSLSYRHLADRDYPMIHEETRDLLGPFFFHCDKALVCSRAMSSKLCTFLCARKRGRCCALFIPVRPSACDENVNQLGFCPFAATTKDGGAHLSISTEPCISPAFATVARKRTPRCGQTVQREFPRELPQAKEICAPCCFDFVLAPLLACDMHTCRKLRCSDPYPHTAAVHSTDC